MVFFTCWVFNHLYRPGCAFWCWWFCACEVPIHPSKNRRHLRGYFFALSPRGLSAYSYTSTMAYNRTSFSPRFIFEAWHTTQLLHLWRNICLRMDAMRWPDHGFCFAAGFHNRHRWTRRLSPRGFFHRPRDSVSSHGLGNWTGIPNSENTFVRITIRLNRRRCISAVPWYPSNHGQPWHLAHMVYRVFDFLPYDLLLDYL